MLSGSLNEVTTAAFMVFGIVPPYRYRFEVNPDQRYDQYGGIGSHLSEVAGEL
jgi:hypothetical protein